MGEFKDLKAVYDMIYSLAVYEKSEDQVKLSYETFAEDSGLSEDSSTPVREQRFQSIVASDTDTHSVVAYALFFYTYSTWEGRALYLEDLFVTEEARGSGLGLKMMQALAKVAVENGCQCFQWQCLDWNKPSLDFYFNRLKAFERVEDDGAKWINVMMKRSRMEDLAKEADA